jgi:alpha-methylacyl-CoA racemase
MGPLSGIRVIEMAGIGPCPFAGMMLADMGAEVLQVDRPGGVPQPFAIPIARDVMARGRRSLALDLKQPAAVATLLDLCASADVLIEGFRPGVMERLGLGPDACLARRTQLVYGRMTGWGQQGPLAPTAGHDINYLSISGVLHAIGRSDAPPTPPINLVADYGGGGVMLVVGVLAALLEARRSGKGQVVDAAMVDGASLLMTMFHGLRAAGLWEDRRGSNLIDTGSYFYDVYETRDGRFVSLGALEPKFFADFLHRAGLDPAEFPQDDSTQWPRLKQRLQEVFRQRTRDEWTALFDGSDACVAPVLSMGEAAEHPHNVARGGFVSAFGVTQPAPAPRFSRTPSAVRQPPREIGCDTRAALADWGIAAQRIDELVRSKAIP